MTQKSIYFKLASLVSATLIIASCGQQVSTTGSLNQLTSISSDKLNNGKMSFGIKKLQKEIFDQQAYLLAYPLVKQDLDNNTAGYNSAYEHYYLYGQYDASPYLQRADYASATQAVKDGFNEQAYLLAYPLVNEALQQDTGSFTDGYNHYYLYGQYDPFPYLQRSGYEPVRDDVIAGYNEDAYLYAYGDVQGYVASGTYYNGYDHFINGGGKSAGRLTWSDYTTAKQAVDDGFNEEAYLLAFPLVKQALDNHTPNFANGYQHYIWYGQYDASPYLQRTEYANAIKALNNGFNKKAYELAYPPSTYSYTDAYTHYLSHTSNLSGSTYGNARHAVYTGFDENVYHDAYPSVTVANAYSDYLSNPSNITTSTYLASKASLGYVTPKRVHRLALPRPTYAFHSSSTYFRYTAKTGPDQGMADIYIDGVYKTTVDLYSSSEVDNVIAYQTNSLSNAVHSVVIKPVGKNSSSSGYGINIESLLNTNTQGEFQVNTYSSNTQSNPSLITNQSNGKFVVVWQSQSHTSPYTDYDIYMQRFDSSGNKEGSETKVNSSSTTDQDIPIAGGMDSSGNFVIAWESTNQDGSGRGIYAQRFNSSGTAQGSEFRVNTTTSGDQASPSVGMDSSGNFVIAWSGNGSGDSTGIFAQRFNNSGTAQGSEFRANTTTSGTQVNASVAVSSAGNFVITWDNNNGIYFQRYNSSGTAQGSETLANTTTNRSQSNPSINIDSSGNFIIAWQSLNQAGGSSGQDIYVQKFNSSGSTVGSEILVNTTTSSTQQNPSVSFDSSGNFVVTWDGNGVGDSGGVFSQRFDSSGNKIGSETLVNTTTSANQTRSNINISPGGFNVVWDNHQYSTDGEIYAQRFDQYGNKL